MATKLEYKKDEQDISRQKKWIELLSKGLDEYCGEDIKNLVMQGAPADPEADQQKFINFTVNAVHTMDTILPPELKKRVMLNCACLYPNEKLKYIKEEYVKHKDSDKAHSMLNELFKENFNRIDGKEEYKKEILERGWGLAGKKVDNIIVISKIPNEIDRYFSAENDKEKRIAYCHCPRIKEVINNDDLISETYCFCGAGFYKNIWEEITGKEVKVEVLETVLKGAEACKFSITLDE